MEQTPNTTTPLPPHPVAPATVSTATVLTASAIAFLLACGVIYTVRQELRQEAATLALSQQDTVEKLERKLRALEAQTAALEARPTTDTAVIEGLRSELGTAKTTIGELTGRITTLEQKPAPAQPPTAVNAAMPATNGLVALRSAVLSGGTYTAELDSWRKEHPTSNLNLIELTNHADSGLPSEASLRAELKTILARFVQTEEPIAEKSWITRLNSHIPGLIKIKKKTTLAPELKALQEQADSASLETLDAHVSELPPTYAARFVSWQEKAQARISALSELTSMDGAQ